MKTCSQAHRRLAILTFPAAAGAALAMVAGCTVQPIGWQGAGRLQGLPEIQMDGGGAMFDAGLDADAGVDGGDIPDGGDNSSASGGGSSASESDSGA